MFVYKGTHLRQTTQPIWRYISAWYNRL